MPGVYLDLAAIRTIHSCVLRKLQRGLQSMGSNYETCNIKTNAYTSSTSISHIDIDYI